MSQVDKIQYRIEKVPPESGWAYIVMIGLGISLGCTWGTYSCISLMLGDFVQNVGGGTSSFTTIMGLVSFSVSFSALFAGSISKMTSTRSTAVIGATLVVIGNVLSIFATSVLHLIICYGLFLGIGVGLWLGNAFATFNHYFVKRRVLMMSMAQTIYGGLLMLYPIIIQLLMNNYGFRGTIAVIAAINGHIIVAMLVMQIVEWHLKSIKVPVEKESQPFLNKDVTEHEVQITEKENHLDVIIEENMVNSELHTLENHLHDKHTKKISLQTIEVINRRMSVISITNVQPAVIAKNWQKLVDMLDLTLLKDIVYVNIISGLTFAHLADSFFCILLPMYLSELNISKDKTAVIMALIAGFDLGARIGLSIVSLFITLNARYLYTAGTVMTILLRFVFLSMTDFEDIAIVAALLGCLKTFIHVPTPLVLAAYLPRDRFVSGFGLYQFLQGLFAFLISPFVGWIHDVTQSYKVFFHTLTLFLAMCAVPWIIEMVWFHIYPRKFKTCDSKSRQK